MAYYPGNYYQNRYLPDYYAVNDTCRFMHPRSPSPPPQPQSQSQSQSESQPDDYLLSSLITSKSLSEPARKLLVLDLNGTLLLRSPRIPKSYRGQYHLHQRPAPRRVMPRPYLTALRAYLFAPQTQTWLDVMVWSSAQPHSVEDMVQHAFGRDRDRLVAIWARDTLGLAEAHYCSCFSSSPLTLMIKNITTH
jgi:hypothetical protein